MRPHYRCRTLFRACCRLASRLADAPKRLLQTASVIGREVPLKLLRAVWETPGTLDVHLLDLKRQEFLYESGHQFSVDLLKVDVHQ
jgi:hypothetical protein